jgi:glycosyltransferase involved in cell wall biosynthesis
MKIAILGTKGIPNNYGGFEQFAEYLSVRLVANGHMVTVYNPSFHGYRDSTFKGVVIRRKFCPEGILGGGAHFIYDFLCLYDALRSDFDIVYEAGYHSVALSFKILNIKNLKSPAILTNMDGLEWKRSKWNTLTRWVIRKLESLAVRECTHLISDNLGVQAYLKSEYGKQSFFVPYGAEKNLSFEESILIDYNLEARDYYILIARLEPENNIEVILDGYLKSGSKKSLIVIGSTSTKHGSILTQKFTKSRIRFIGGVFKKPDLDALRHFSLAYFHGHSVGGTNPSLLEAMACECLIAAHQNHFNQSILGKDAIYFSDAEEVATTIRKIDSQQIRNENEWKEKNLEKITNLYNWDLITHSYEKIFAELIAR